MLLENASMLFINRRYRFLGRRILTILIGIGTLIFLFTFVIKPLFSGRKFISPLPDAAPTPQGTRFLFGGSKSSPSPTAVPVLNTQELISSIKQITDKATGTYSVYVVDLNTKQSFGFNETTIFTAASVIKVPILAALYHEAAAGKIDLDRRITIQAADIQDYGTGVIRYKGAGQVYSLKTLAQLMMEKSDNTAAFVLDTVITQPKIQSLIDGWGMSQTDLTNNKTSNKDIANLMIKMRAGEIANKALTQEMIGFMDDSDFENRIPKLLPTGIKVFHKIGNEVGFVHDVGIVEDPKHPFYIGVMSNDIRNDEEAESVIAQVAKLVYDFMSK